MPNVCWRFPRKRPLKATVSPRLKKYMSKSSDSTPVFTLDIQNPPPIPGEKVFGSPQSLFQEMFYGFKYLLKMYCIWIGLCLECVSVAFPWAKYWAKFAVIKPMRPVVVLWFPGAFRKWDLRNMVTDLVPDGLFPELLGFFQNIAWFVEGINQIVCHAICVYTYSIVSTFW